MASKAPPNNPSMLLGKATFGYAVLHLFIYLRSRIGDIFSSFRIKKVCLSRMPRSQSTKNCSEIPSFSPSALSNISCFVLLVSISYLLLPWRPKSTFNCFVPRLDVFFIQSHEPSYPANHVLPAPLASLLSPTAVSHESHYD
jgi:hypothetical protein